MIESTTYIQTLEETTPIEATAFTSDNTQPENENSPHDTQIETLIILSSTTISCMLIP
jgi:hypothetical protein